MNTIKSKIKSLLPTLQDVHNIREYVVVGSRQLQIVLLNYRIHKLADKLEKAQIKKWKLVDKNIKPLVKEIDYHNEKVLADICEEMESVRNEC